MKVKNFLFILLLSSCSDVGPGGLGGPGGGAVLTPQDPPESPPPDLGILWADIESVEDWGKNWAIRSPLWTPDGDGLVFAGGGTYTNTHIGFLNSGSDTGEIIVSHWNEGDSKGQLVTGFDLSDRKLYYIHLISGEQQFLSEVDLETKESRILMENRPLGSLEVSSSNQFLLVDNASETIAINLKTLEYVTWNSVLGGFSQDEPDKLVLLYEDTETGWFWRFVDMDSGIFEDKPFSSLFPGFSSTDISTIHDFRYVNNEVNLLWKRSTDNEWFLVNSKSGTYYNFRLDHYGSTFRTPQYYFSKSYNKCIAITQVSGTKYNFQIELLDFKKGIKVTLVDSYRKDWYKFEHFSFSDDETKLAFQFRDQWNQPHINSIYWMEI